MPKTLNIAVIGAGTMAQAVHLPVLRRRWDRFAVTALVDHSPRRRRESSEVWGIAEDRRYESVADLIAAVRAKTVAVDAALLSTDGLHVEDLLQLMKRGIPVLVEPPLGYSAEEIAQVADFERMTGRRLTMMAYPQQYDDAVVRMGEHIATKDLRMVDHEVLMPASQPLFGQAHVTTSSYDIPTDRRTERRKALQSAVEVGAGEGATQRDRDLYVKGLLTGVAHQMAVTEAAYGPITSLIAVRHWPKGVIPGSIELLGELEGGAQVRLVWHYLPFAPEYSERLQVLSARRRMRVELAAPSHGDERSTVSMREKKSGVVQETSTLAPKGSAESMWEAFHAFVEKGVAPVSGAAEAQRQVGLLREVLAAVVAADGRSLEGDPGAKVAAGEETEPEDVASETESADGDVSADGSVAPGAAAVAAPVVTAPPAEPAVDEPGFEELAVAEPIEAEAVDSAPPDAEPESAEPESAEPAPAPDEPSHEEPATAPGAQAAAEVHDVWSVEESATPKTFPAGGEAPEERRD
ncbi:Gfo/Idh/MocA family oxidoreductase [Brachybacterium aquaticum]|uniref:Gfo/Idh/MocA-like oxidoreductase N-terminal domain-containing protein n=1 Tax=Brachybacterium aquaticum TaxID=1432564 RepID=A0A841A988_9MICO|nr:Gfo/Idh/MocA family oxidoreductase [Brachybacterium aquaticum]MBB5830503.1 hypothetical protein [Brachybacterium aquaticum]